MLETEPAPTGVDQPAVPHDGRIEVAGEVEGKTARGGSVELAGVEAAYAVAAGFIHRSVIEADEGDLVPGLFLGDHVLA